MKSISVLCTWHHGLFQTATFLLRTHWNILCCRYQYIYIYMVFNGTKGPKSPIYLIPVWDGPYCSPKTIHTCKCCTLMFLHYAKRSQSDRPRPWAASVSICCWLSCLCLTVSLSQRRGLVARPLPDDRRERLYPQQLRGSVRLHPSWRVNDPSFPLAVFLLQLWSVCLNLCYTFTFTS